MKKQVHQDVYVGVVCLLFCAAVFFLNYNLNSGAGVMPLLLDALLAIFSVVILLNGLRKTNSSTATKEKKALTVDGMKTPFLIWCLIGVYVLLFYLAGYLVATGIMLPVFMVFMKQRNWKAIAAIDIVYLVIVYAVFVQLLGVNVGGFGLLGRLL